MISFSCYSVVLPVDIGYLEEVYEGLAQDPILSLYLHGKGYNSNQEKKME